MSDNPDNLRPELSRVEDRLSGVEQAMDRLDESISGVEDELRKFRGDMTRGFDGTANRRSEGVDSLRSDIHQAFDDMETGFEQQHQQMRRLLFLFGVYITVLIILAGLI